MAEDKASKFAASVMFVLLRKSGAAKPAIPADHAQAMRGLSTDQKATR
jgi:hypothetical protein